MASFDKRFSFRCSHIDLTAWVKPLFIEYLFKVVPSSFFFKTGKSFSLPVIFAARGERRPPLFKYSKSLGIKNDASLSSAFWSFFTISFAVKSFLENSIAFWTKYLCGSQSVVELNTVILSLFTECSFAVHAVLYVPESPPATVMFNISSSLHLSYSSM